MSSKTRRTTPAEPIYTTQRQTFITGFVACSKCNKRILQDNIEHLFSRVRSRGRWNNNPNCLIKYALKRMFMRNVIAALKSSNYLNFTVCNSITPLFPTTKYKTPPSGDRLKKVADATEMNTHRRAFR